MQHVWSFSRLVVLRGLHHTVSRILEDAVPGLILDGCPGEASAFVIPAYSTLYSVFVIILAISNLTPSYLI